MIGHQEFEQLCALYAAGGLSDEQIKRLDEHLEGCLDCRRVLQEFQEIASMGLPALAPDFAALADSDRAGCVPERAQQRLLARIQNEILTRVPIAEREHGKSPQGPLAGTPLQIFKRARALVPYAAAILVVVGISFYSYHLGAKRVASVSEPKLQQVQSKLASQQDEFAQLEKDHEALRLRLKESDEKIGLLSAEIRSGVAEISSLKEQEHRLRTEVKSAETSRIASESERVAVSRRLAEAQASLDATQKQLASAREERMAQQLQIVALEKRLNDTSALLRERDETIREQQDLLAYDRDIRDLIGARDLYVAEVTDVGRDAETQKPFGRVFFTKGKSLIFYAYDLDRQPGLRAASTFQAWGRRGPDFSGSLPLGIMYLDASSKKRWVLKFDDPETLAKIDAVFVTVEPKGGSRKPTGTPLLFAYLKVEPNHP